MTKHVVNDASHWLKNGEVLKGSGRRGLRVEGLRLRVKGSRLRVEGLGFRVSGLGFRV